jgi:excinuclease ABC subunit A
MERSIPAPNAVLSYYQQQSPFTDPGSYASLYDGLPADPDALTEIVQGLLLHKLAVEFFHLTLSPAQRAEQHLRTIQQHLKRIVQVHPAPLVEPRPPELRQVGVCRDFALLHVSLLRHVGIPARMRVGFARYLDPKGSLSIDHWISEYWDFEGERWVLTDPGLAGPACPPALREQIEIATGFTDLLHDRDFFLAGSAWKLARQGKVAPLLFRFNGHWKGMPCIRGNLLHDFQALNKLELNVFDYWDDLSRKTETALAPDDRALLDRIADLTVRCSQGAGGPHFELYDLFEELPRTWQIRSQLRLLGIGEVELRAPEPELRPPAGPPARPPALESMAQPTGASLAFSRNGSQPASDAPAKLADRAPRNEYIPYDVPPGSPLALMQEQVALGWQAQPGYGDILVRGARQHNLKRIDVRIPRHKLVVITGVSGSGKSSLAFDTIYAEGQRRYVESLSSYARQFMEQMEKPQVDQIVGLSPAVAIEQKTISRNPRSTVGTVTEILDYLRVLYARIGLPHCPQCGRAVVPQSAQQITDQLARLPAGTRFHLLAPIVRGRKGAYTSTLAQAVKDGFTRARIDGELVDLAESQRSKSLPVLDKNKRHDVELVVDRLVVPGMAAGMAAGADEAQPADFTTRLMDSVETALRAGQGILIVHLLESSESAEQMITLSEHNACPVCDLSFPELEPNLFSFNSPFGMCDECTGLGVVLQVDPELIINRPDLSLLDGASPWYRDMRKKGEGAWQMRNLISIARHYGVNLEQPWNELPEQFRRVILYGSGGEKIHFKFDVETDSGSWRGESVRDVKGIIYHINRLFRQTKSEGSRRYYLQFMSRLPCPKCHGERLCAVARYVTVGGKRLPELSGYSIAGLHEWIAALPGQFNAEQHAIADELVQEIHQRLNFIRNVGLHYLTLNRPAPTLSGGEGQRIRLASQIGSGLVGVLYILDEPSIGLHARDHRALLDTLIHLRDLGNTVLVVEHDAATMRVADWLIDLGPGPGILGGELVAEGTPEEVMANPASLTGQYLAGKLQVTAPNGRHRRAPRGWLIVHNARLHNLKNIDARFPLGMMICVTGVSGSGKSSLIAQTLHPALARALHNAQTVSGPHDWIEGLEQVDKVINITQEPIGRNPRSNPGTYVGALDEIRKVFASTPESRTLGYSAGRFSFNVKGGRCEACAGYGFKKVEMHFLPDVWVTCKECNGKRFNRQTLNITYKGKNIAEILDMDVQQALEFFAPFPAIARILQTLHDVGLDYLKLGQSALTLSGGEAQRVKLARELSAVATGRTIYILDEPTTGLHFADIQRLLDVLHRLVDAGNTVIVIEHNLDVIKTADWVIDLGPEGGEEGGSIVAEGPPEAIATASNSFTGQVLDEILLEERR